MHVSVMSLLGLFFSRSVVEQAQWQKEGRNGYPVGVNGIAVSALISASSNWAWEEEQLEVSCSPLT